MTTLSTLGNVKIYTTFDNDMNMIGARMETETRELSVSLGRVSKTWSIFLDSKTNTTTMGHNKNLRTYVNKSYKEMIEYWDMKLIQLNK